MEKAKVRTAIGGITAEFRGMTMGETVIFPMEKYNYNSIRSTGSTLVTQRAQGWKWKTRVDFDDKCIYVWRVS